MKTFVRVVPDDSNKNKVDASQTMPKKTVQKVPASELFKRNSDNEGVNLYKSHIPKLRKVSRN